MHGSVQVLRELVILAGFALAITLVFQRLRIPTITGFILTGVLIGPGGFRLVSDPGTVHMLAEIGVVLLLFMVGLELTIPDLRALGVRPVLTGIGQVGATAGVVALALMLTGAHPARALFFGFLISLSSTALLLKLFTDRAELQSPHGRLTLGVLLLQDLALVPLTVITPLLADWSQGDVTRAPGLDDVMRVAFMILAATLAIAAAWRFVPWLLASASRTRSREAFLAAIVLVVLGSAYASQMAGLSLALGAFIAGLILSGSELRSQVAADVLPFRDTLSSVFFISIGMLFSPVTVLRDPGTVIAATLGVVVLKAFVAISVVRLAGYSWGVGIPAALALAHVGEFSFVLARGGTSNGLLPPVAEQAFLAAALFSLLVAPWLVAHGPAWAMRIHMLLGAPPEDAASGVPGAGYGPHSELASGHVVIAGYGLNGRNVARVLRAVHIPHVVLDHSPEALATCSADGSEALLGNAVQPEILRRAGIARARALVLALSDPLATRHAAQLARTLNPHLFTVVRTRYVREIDAFYEAGANLVIPEEFETSIEISTAVLRQFHVPHNIVQAQIDLLRRERYSLMRGMKLPGSVIHQLDTLFLEGTTETVLVLQHSPAVGHTLEEMGLVPVAAARSPDVPAADASGTAQTSLALDTAGAGTRRPLCRIIAVVRGAHVMTDLPSDVRLEVGDTLVLTGDHAQIDDAIERMMPADL